jgi:nitroimidazol reductase NimA-like FMN-containing flavoprotein (pyridoxamine 5'-phosphate oxidase superfamily)
MIREMRRQDRLLSRPEAIAIMEKGDYGVLACSDCEYSYAVPLSYVWDDGVIFFHSARQGHKLDNLRANPRVSFAVVETFEALPGKFAANYRSAIAFGKAGEVLGRGAGLYRPVQGQYHCDGDYGGAYHWQGEPPSMRPTSPKTG